MSAIRQRKKAKNAFGATSPPFIDYLKEILRRYPDGGQILKELIQNADDAGASEAVFIYDERVYGTDSVWSEALGKYQGPALYAFNDAAFTEEDWEGIQRAGRSIKHDDPTKVGRFGIGFNSVYHITDLPSVLSSSYLAVFDPQKRMFDEDREGYRWSLEDETDQRHLFEFTDQFKPFQDIVSLMFSRSWEEVINEHYFKGTLFRFPLRNETSDISDNLYDSQKVTELFDSFIADAGISLLFLRTLSSITLIHIDINGTVSVRMKVSVSSARPLQEQEVEDFQRQYVKGDTCFRSVSCTSPQEKETKTEWLVTSCLLMEGHVPEIDSLAVKLHFQPQVDVAFQCDKNRLSINGRLSCFLPLPNNDTNDTRLPVHINACFGLTDNRRYIKWREEDQKNDESAMWNELLIREVLPHVYVQQIQDAVELCKKSLLPASTVYSLWPDLSKMEHKSRWHEVAMDVFKRLFQQKELFCLADKENRWVGALDAIFPDTDMTSAVVKLLIAAGENIVTIPEHVLKAIKKAFPEPASLKWVSPCFVRTVLRKTKTEDICRNDRLSLLEYVLSDQKYEELRGLQLLPLSDGSFRSFSNEEECTALIDNEEFSRVLLPFCKERFLPDDLSSNLIYHLREMAVTNPDMYKIINLDASNVATMAKKHLPQDWKETQSHVKWNLNNDGHPPKQWLKEFWKFLNTHWEELNGFIGMPLIPLEPLQKSSGTIQLARIEKNPTLIFMNSRESSLSDQIQKVVKIVGGTVINKDECLRHHDIERYVLTSSPKNVLQVLLNSDKDKVINGIASASLNEKEEFKMYISFLDSLSEAEQKLLSALPLFRLMSGKYVAVELKQAVVLKSNPSIPSDLPVPETIVQCANEADRRLLTLLKVDLLDAAQLAIYLVDSIKKMFFNKEDEQKVMSWILNHGNVLFSQNEELYQKSKNLPFIETEEGERKCPSSVFDPTNRIFKDLFEEDFFPPSVYRSQAILQSLRQLGLQTKEEDISSVNVLHVATQIQKLRIHSRNKAFKKADVLLGVLNRNDLLTKFSEEERTQLIHLQWMPCENPNSVNNITSVKNSNNSMNSQKRGLYKPAEIRASKYFAIVGHVMPLAPELSESLSQKLDLFQPPPADKVLENLCVLGSVTSAMVSPDSDYKFKNKLHSTYKFMQDNIEYFREVMSKKCITWLWSHNEFVSPRDVVLSYPAELDLSLYIKKVADEFLQYDKMLKEFGVKETLSDAEIEDILHDIKQSIDEREPPYGDPSELKLSIAILDFMRKNEKPLKNSTPVPVREQNENFTLRPLKDTVFCDIGDEGLDDLRAEQEEFYVIHEEVLRVTAKWLKIPFLSTRILKAQPITVEEECTGIEQCGQTEPITQRIKNILKEYDEERDIFKELIQNAEDAGASACGFLLDFRTHPNEGLIDEGMALCNGPCLWSFNNGLFTDEDWKNIVSVGSASKESKVDKIGKFGLGFNAVYHLTDIPSILSGKSLLILDPNVTHLEKHIRSKANPGIKLDLFQERLFRRFPGQFKAYEGIFDFDFSQSNQKYYNGTLIKLPFRTREEACKSEISSKVYDEVCINTFQQHLKDDSQTPLLFLKNVNSVSLQVVSECAFTPPAQQQIQTVIEISKDVVCSINISNEMYLQDIRNTLEYLDTSCHKTVDCFAAHIDKIVHKQNEKSRNQYWLRYSCFGTKNSLRMFQTEIQQFRFPLPIGGVAVPLQREAQNVWSPDASCIVGQAFCFLPLPIETGLPVQINGSFAVMSNRKALWESGIKLEWNNAILQDAAVTAYITVLLELKKMAQNGTLQNYVYYTFWPDIEKVSESFQPLLNAFYSAIAQSRNERSLELFNHGQTWCSTDKARFLDPVIEEHKAVGDLAVKVFLNNAEPGYCTVPLPSWVRNSFIKCGFTEMVNERTFHWVEFYQVVCKNLNNMDPHCRNVLIVNAIDLNDQEVDELLKSYPCIPNQNGELQFISKLVNPQGKVACLYELEEGRFLHGTKSDYFALKRIQRLIGLGMLSDTLTLEDVIERAKTVSRVWAEDKSDACTRLQCLFDCMKERIDIISPHWETLKHMPFIPARGIDQDNNVKNVLKKPSEVYSYSCHNLVNMTEFTVDNLNLAIHPNNPVLTKLGVKQSPPTRTVLKQLTEAHNRSDALEKSVLLEMAESCYMYLNQFLIEGKNTTDIINHAQSVPFVFVGDRFVNVRSVAKSKEFEQKPYLYVLPAMFSKFENLWNSVGIETHFTAEQFVAVLEEMGTCPQPLSESDLSKCITIINRLYQFKDKMIKECLLPNERRVLTLSKKLHFNDSPWMPVQAGLNLCHGLIPRPVACHFGVITTRHHTLQNHLVSGFSPFAKEFGQHEKLTVRIKNIIEAYPSKRDILKELIQNADDAQATEIHFVWDKRKHQTKKIFGKKWESLQGPALCVYNNTKFSNEDLIGIQQLGEGGKHGTLGRTGKYGLGFNSVYQLTDCPSILTGDEYLCISDPNLNYVEGGTKQAPGCMYSMDKMFKESFKDVYHTFLPDKFTLHSGTMFRLPLRTEQMAAKSEISRHVVTDDEMKMLFFSLVQDPEELILFLKRVTKIQFHEISPDGKEQNGFLIEKKHTINANDERQDFQNNVQNYLISGKVIPCQTIYNVQISAGKKTSSWIIAECFGCGKWEQSLNHKVPQVALAACVGKNPSESLHYEFPGRAFCSLPLPVKTGLPVHVNGNFEVDSSRRDLWKEDAESLKTEWNTSLILNSIAPLYADLLTHLCTMFKTDKAYGLFSLDSVLQFIFKYFPFISKDVGQIWQVMISEVYRSIHQRNLPVIPTLKRAANDRSHLSDPKFTANWSSVSKPDSTDSPHFMSENHKGLLHVLEHLGMNLVPCSFAMEKVQRSFNVAGVQVAEVSPVSVIRYLKKKPMNDPLQTSDELPLPITKTLFKDKLSFSKLLTFCLTHPEEKIGSVDLNGVPLLLTEDQMIRKFSSDCPKLITRFSEIFLGHGSEFADFVNNQHILTLQKGKYVEKLTIPVAAKYLKPIILDLVQQSLPSQRNELYKWLRTLWEFFEDEAKFQSSNEPTVFFSELKKHFTDSPIVPVISPSQKDAPSLQTITNLHAIVPNSKEKLTSILIKLGFMTLDYTFFNASLTTFTSSLRPFVHNFVEPELLNTQNISAVLEQLHQLPHSQFEAISGDEANELQQHLQNGIKTMNIEYHRMFKSLPLFETILGKRQRIDWHRNVFILKTEFLKRFPDLYEVDDRDSIFLKDNWVNINLSRSLNLKILEDLEYCVQFILPSMHKFNENQTLNLVRLLLELKQKTNYKDYKERIASVLRNVRFIPDIYGRLQMASYFFDKGVTLYKVMLPEERFVPKTFWKLFQSEKHQTKCFLKDLGLKHKVSEEELIEFALQIESDMRGNTELHILKQRSSILLRAVLDKHAEKQSFMNRIATIKFIFPVEIKPSLCEYHNSFAQKRDAVAIKGSLMEKDLDHQNLIWTSMPILPSEDCSIKDIKIMKSAGALEAPPSEKVVQNLINVCRSQCKTKSLILTRATVFTKSYAYLQSVHFDSSVLTDLPLVLVENDTELVAAIQAVLTLQDATDFRPYLYPIQAKHAIYREFFKQIGVQEVPTAAQFCNVLKEIYMECANKNTLQPNQMKTVQRTVQQLFSLLQQQPEESHFDKNTLYLPSTDGKLYESNTLFFNDTTFQAKRLEEPLQTKLKLLEKLCNCHLGNDHYKHQKLLQLLPQGVHPQLLSHVISEDLVDAQVEHCNYGSACELSGWFEKHLSSQPFLQGLICLIREESKGAISQSVAESMCEKTFGQIQIVCCRALQTVLLLNQESLDGTMKETQVYVKKQQDKCVFYLKHNDNMTPQVISEVNMYLSKEINGLLENVLTSSFLLILTQLLLCESMGDVERLLEENGVHNGESKEDGLNGHPKPGSLVPEEWYDSLDMHPLNSFEKGEYVAFKNNESTSEYFFAIVVECLDEASGGMRKNPLRYKIEIGINEFIEVSSLDLYQFKREKVQSCQAGNATCRELDILPGPAPSQTRPAPSQTRPFPQTLNEVKQEIDQSLDEIWQMSNENKQKAIRRLYLRWHPDKNPHNQELANEAFKYLQNRIEELETGKIKHNMSSSWNDFKNYYSKWNDEARSHRRGRERFYQNNSRRQYNFWSYYREMPRPNRAEAKRWYRQAQCDLAAAQNETDDKGSPEWCLFKVHQAVEKALIATEYRRSGQRLRNMSIRSLADKVFRYAAHLSDLPHAVDQLRALGVDSKTTQYPDCHPRPHIPNEQFRFEDAAKAVNIAREVLLKLDEYITQ